uniref:Uncharacterized protein n=1 Tax=Hucho hucho TaxID=62062 RepID=A0A4W5LHT7_9TELE
MMTRITVLKWLYHFYIKTPRKMFWHTDSLFPMLLKTLSDESDDVSTTCIILAEIASSTAGQTDSLGSCVYSDSKLELQIPEGAKAGPQSVLVGDSSPSTPSMSSYFYKFMINLLKRFSLERKLLENRGVFIMQLCLLLHAENIFHSMTLNTIMLTSVISNFTCLTEHRGCSLMEASQI